MSKARNDFGVFFWIHLLVIIFAYTSWLWVSWWIVATLVAAFFIQLATLKTCVLSKAQFHSEKVGFHTYYLRKIGFKVNQKRVKLLVDRIFPWVGIILAILWQKVLGFSPILF